MDESNFDKRVEEQRTRQRRAEKDQTGAELEQENRRRQDATEVEASLRSFAKYLAKHVPASPVKLGPAAKWYGRSYSSPPGWLIASSTPIQLVSSTHTLVLLEDGRLWEFSREANFRPPTRNGVRDIPQDFIEWGHFDILGTWFKKQGPSNEMSTRKYNDNGPDVYESLDDYLAKIATTITSTA